MTDASYFAGPVVAPKPLVAENAAHVPKPQTVGAPVFMTDAITPLAGETLLSLLMKRMLRDAAHPGGDQP